MKQGNITIGFNDELKVRIKVRVALLGITIKQYVTQLIEKDLAEADKEQTAQKEK